GVQARRRRSSYSGRPPRRQQVRMRVRTCSLTDIMPMSCQVVSGWSVPSSVSLAPLVTYFATYAATASSPGPSASKRSRRTSSWAPSAAPPHQRPQCRGSDLDPTRRCPYGIGQAVDGAPGGGFVAGPGRAVEADDGVHVDGCPLLILGDAGEGQPGMLGESGLHEADRGSQTPAGRL